MLDRHYERLERLAIFDFLFVYIIRLVLFLVCNHKSGIGLYQASIEITDHACRMIWMAPDTRQLMATLGGKGTVFFCFILRSCGVWNLQKSHCAKQQQECAEGTAGCEANQERNRQV